jgi:hypothetical protein
VDVVTPIYPGTAKRLGPRKPPPPLEYAMEMDMTAFNASMKGLREFMAENDRMIQEAFARLVQRMARHRP